jgi:microcystin-dependent protein
VDYISDGTSWIRKSSPAGTVVDWFLPAATAPTGWVLYDGSNLPASTGIYADLFAHLGTLTKPDTQGRFTVAKGTNGDVTTIGVSDGLAVGTRSPKHNMTNGLTIPNHAHGVGTLDGTIRDPAIHDGNAGPAATAWSSSAPGSAQYQNPATVAIAGNTGNPTTLPAVPGTIGPGGTRPTDSGAFIVCSKIGKL